MMVYGAVKKRKVFLLPWLILGLTVILGTMICLILSIIWLPVAHAITILIIGLIQIRKNISLNCKSFLLAKRNIIFLLQLLWSTSGSSSSVSISCFVTEIAWSWTHLLKWKPVLLLTFESQTNLADIFMLNWKKTQLAQSLTDLISFLQNSSAFWWLFKCHYLIAVS